MKRLFQFFCILIYFFSFFSVGFAGIEGPPCGSIEGIKKTILTKMAEARSYQLEATVKIDDTVVLNKIIGITPDRLRFEQSFSGGKNQVQITEVFDGKVQWIESRKSENIQVIDITDQIKRALADG
jgi:hypothetical protein